ncbi:MAG: DUF362 domain-containing protein [Desulfohalobiaceae bacterium]|nr:DUF362 domain-containing protein [Desulfohalobiaceae bacterium]
MAANVFFWNLSSSRRVPFDRRLRRLLKESGYASFLRPGDLVALKVHFGEKGSSGYIGPRLLKPVVDFFRKTGVKPFLTDTNTLYVGQRGETVSHALQAAEHGFDPLLLKAPVVIADGLKSNHEVSVIGPGRHFEHCYLAGDILDADSLINISHVTGHELTGYAGALKNLGMGCATRKGKMHQHCGLGPGLDQARCLGCGDCIEVCGGGALWLDVEGKINIDRESCTGCAACLLACRQAALQVDFKVEIPVFLERMVEYAGAVLSAFTRPVLHLNYLLHITPGCDCSGGNNGPVCPDLGVLASLDPLALDQASHDLVNQAPGQTSVLPAGWQPGEDKFAALHPSIEAQYCFEYAWKLGLGSREYRLVLV